MTKIHTFTAANGTILEIDDTTLCQIGAYYNRLCAKEDVEYILDDLYNDDGLPDEIHEDTSLIDEIAEDYMERMDSPWQMQNVNETIRDIALTHIEDKYDWSL